MHLRLPGGRVCHGKGPARTVGLAGPSASHLARLKDEMALVLTVAESLGNIASVCLLGGNWV
jgi:hypothetical protein